MVRCEGCGQRGGDVLFNVGDDGSVEFNCLACGAQRCLSPAEMNRLRAWALDGESVSKAA